MIRIFLVRQYQKKNLKTFFVNNGWTIFAVLFFADPSLLEDGWRKKG